MAEEGVVEQVDKSGKWEELDHDLLNEIANLNYCYDDYVRMRSVCKQWNMALPKVPETHTRNPWLVLPFEYKILDRQLLAEKKIYHLKLPEMHDKKLRGSSYGWLTSVAVDGTLRIINPFIKDVYFDLPPIQALPDIVSYDPDMYNEEYTVKDIKVGDTYTVESVLVQMTHVQKVILSCPPDDDKQECMALVIYDSTYVRLAFCRLGDDKWIDIPKSSKDTEEDCQYEYQDAIFNEGKIYVIDFKGQLFEFDIKTRSIPVGGISQVPPPQDLLITHPGGNQTYLTGCPKGGLLMVVRYLNFYRHPEVKKGRQCYNSRFAIYKLNKGLKQWSKVFNLGEDCALFIGYNSSVWMSTPNGWGNRIYYTDNMLEAQISEKVGGHDIGVFNLEDGKISQLFPDSFLLCPPPVWL